MALCGCAMSLEGVESLKKDYCSELVLLATTSLMYRNNKELRFHGKVFQAGWELSIILTPRKSSREKKFKIDKSKKNYLKTISIVVISTRSD